MKNITLLGFLCLACVVGCTTTAVRTAYNTLATIAEATDGAKKVYASAYVDNRINFQTHLRVQEVEKKYNAAFETAVIAARFDYQQPAPTNVIASATQLINVITEVVK